MFYANSANLIVNDFYQILFLSLMIADIEMKTVYQHEYFPGKNFAGVIHPTSARIFFGLS